ncbi:hypothetical protein H112_08486 [Trichophyton rubrum D6]|uniref:Uncharacterized protein n=3 Tax=Trichophyton TaxID=5550 RepID=A0A080WKD3_TRIRC|nr:uncharacterized protein TERG_11672 [Trichophyton rubrum CBS 118892]EZF10296.1 hypothetical protein H100_08508 [Trichophyton rubrum MR850]EZF37188.1 hypothetical protein H102_08468 [Trichophyton rubrum CBS 100081]EZF47749.1 hypothetical protein H103_08489 [Trichophyton rubrum CBS 288.86]EZF58540.1 hypothetical protein H104_08443 [Trichophyton rubrum CBS 289.86]EZF68946.1 hypothetical protein H105_08496 [Trichophyton soudanense CBS 452.61]EZF79668.1 hypothetical protein H110_08493 [Trichophy
MSKPVKFPVSSQSVLANMTRFYGLDNQIHQCRNPDDKGLHWLKLRVLFQSFLYSFLCLVTVPDSDLCLARASFDSNPSATSTKSHGLRGHTEYSHIRCDKIAKIVKNINSQIQRRTKRTYHLNVMGHNNIQDGPRSIPRNQRSRGD